MTKKDFILIAKALRASRPGSWPPDNPRAEWNNVVDEIVKALAQTDIRFDEDKFRKACGDE